jgi:hypothetical protein
MQVFEFHFNPPKPNRLAAGKDSLLFDSFCFEPKNVYEKRLGSLYVIGLLKNALPQNARFLNALAEKIKEKYYKSASSSPERSLRDALKSANEYLEKIAKEGDVSWLGNLSLAVVSLTQHQKNGSGELNFTKVGDLKLFLLRKGHLIDIDQKLKYEDIEPYPLKIFGNVVSGKLAENDIILALSKDVHSTFLKENLLNEIAAKSIEMLLPEKNKKFRDILNGKKEQLAKISGICLLVVLSRQTALKETETLGEKSGLTAFSFKEIFKPLTRLPQKIKKTTGLFRFSKIIEKNKTIKAGRLSEKFKKPRVSLAFFKKPGEKTILILVLAGILTLGFFLFEKREKEEIKNYQSRIEQIQEKMDRAESLSSVAEYSQPAEKNANLLYQEIWKEISSLSKTAPKSLNKQITELENLVLENLYRLNKLTEISEPDLIFEFEAKEFVPQRLILFKDKICFFSPHSENIFELSENGQGEIVETGKAFGLAAPFQDSLVFFSKPNEITIFKENRQLTEPLHLKELSSAVSFSALTSYLSNLYFLDAENDSVVKYPFLSGTNWGDPQIWLSAEIKNTDFTSLTIDGSIWLLGRKKEDGGNQTIERYHNGSFQETLNLEIFPPAGTFSKIYTALGLSELYILDPGQRRMIIADKTGRVLEQYQSEKFDNLLDFAISEKDKTIYLLNGLKVYRIDSNQ